MTDRALNNGACSAYDWDKKVIVVTGGSGGIGPEIVKKLEGRGTKIVVLDVLPLIYTKISRLCGHPAVLFSQ
ncbi:hypothetical protein PspLS_01745 [Pyricularia sp. CBS 133598]|nr:hypothetical protein PspLS_01745 [Pyricularia sp. CBS 133598]